MVKTKFSICLTEYKMQAALDGVNREIGRIVFRAPMIDDGPACAKLQALVKSIAQNFALKNRAALADISKETEEAKKEAARIEAELDASPEKRTQYDADMYQSFIENDVDNVVEVLAIFKDILFQVSHFEDVDKNRIEYKYEIIKSQPASLLYQMVGEYMGNFLPRG